MANQLLLTPKQQQKVCPKAIQGLQVLALPVTEMDEFLENIILDNPLIELDLSESKKNAVENEGTEFLRSTSNQKKNNLMENLAAGEGYQGNVHESETLHGFLHLQLLMCNLSHEEEVIGEEIIGNINDDGYFVGDLREIAFQFSESLPVVQRLLKTIQSFSPLGVGAKNIEECLILQIDAFVPNYHIVIEIIQNDLEDLADKRMSKLSKKYGLKKDELQRILDYIRTLNPRPGNMFEKSMITNYIIPDVLVRKSGSEFTIIVNNDTRQVVNINQQYLHLLHNKEIKIGEKDYIRGKHNEARNLMKCLEMRYETLKKLAFFLLNEQYSFFECGPSELKPLMMQQAADALEVHVSTISRAVQGKYIQTPWGMFPLKYFFNSNVTKKSEENTTATQVKLMIQKMIHEENTLQPLSDLEITEILNRKGITISRRTVAKYRKALGIAGQNKRKNY
ncbi:MULTISPECIES: RNA polymerase factor sigma-54 [Bacillus]|uniref:RNA polymerase factor sigma-54 n=1 Tax=Bacillus TaxID=1386 RepID=UPI0002F466E0|nr:MULTISPECIES: RNA polymerase factor sigma-54 [Bacillus]